MDGWLTAGNIADVQGRVGDDVELAREALAEESAKGDDARSTLVEWLQRIVSPPPEPDADADEEESSDDDAIGPETFTAEADDDVDTEAEAVARERIGPERFDIEE